MTVSKDYNKHIYEGNGLTRDWPYDFDLPITAAGTPDTSLIHVFRTNLRGEVTEVTAFSVDAETGTLTYPVSGSPLETGEKLTILRLLDVRQQFFDPSNQGNLYPETLEDNTDRLVMMVQQLQEETDRAVKVSLSTDLETEDTTAEGIFEARDIALSAATASEGWANTFPAIADELDVNIVLDEADLRAKLAAIGASNASLVIATTIPIAADLAIPSNVALSFKKTGQLQPAEGTTLTINGAIDAGPWQIFTGSGSISGLPNVDYIYVEWFGAAGDGITDSTAAIQAACDWATQSNVPVKSNTGAFIITSTLIILCNGDLSRMTINVDGGVVTPAVRIGGIGANNYNRGRRIDLPKVNNTTKPSDGWSAFNSVGIWLANCIEMDIGIPYVRGFCNGVVCGGDAGGFAYNNVRLGNLIDNKRNLVLIGGTNNGWCNENIFYNGRLWFTSSCTTDYTGTRMIVLETVVDKDDFRPDGNLFIKPSIESPLVEYSIEIHGRYNTFLNARYEGEGALRILNAGNYFNNFIGGYNVQGITFTQKNGAPSGHNYSNINGHSPHFRTLKYTIEGTAFPTGWELATFTNRSILSENTASMFVSNGYMAMRASNNTTEGKPTVSLGAVQAIPALMFNSKVLTDGVGFFSYGEGIGVRGDLFPVDRSDYSAGNYSLGIATKKWTEVYAVNGTIQTSDERAKAEISTIPDEWLDAWGDVEYSRFKMLDAVQKKGSEKARWHIGIIAQRVKEAFEARGLDAMKIGLLCYDEWEDKFEDVTIIDTEAVHDEEGNLIEPEVSHTGTEKIQSAGNLYSIRYDEALAMEAAYMRREVERLNALIGNQ